MTSKDSAFLEVSHLSYLHSIDNTAYGRNPEILKSDEVGETLPKKDTDTCADMHLVVVWKERGSIVIKYMKTDTKEVLQNREFTMKKSFHAAASFINTSVQMAAFLLSQLTMC